MSLSHCIQIVFLRSKNYILCINLAFLTLHCLQHFYLSRQQPLLPQWMSRLPSYCFQSTTNLARFSRYYHIGWPSSLPLFLREWVPVGQTSIVLTFPQVLWSLRLKPSVILELSPASISDLVHHYQVLKLQPIPGDFSCDLWVFHSGASAGFSRSLQSYENFLSSLF